MTNIIDFRLWVAAFALVLFKLRFGKSVGKEFHRRSSATLLLSRCAKKYQILNVEKFSGK